MKILTKQTKLDVTGFYITLKQLLRCAVGREIYCSQSLRGCQHIRLVTIDSI